MNFDGRTYPDIVRDLLTILRGGTASETITLGTELPDVFHLENRPIQRISHLQGQVSIGGDLVDYRFTERDFELVGSDLNPTQYVGFRFRPKGHRPAPGTVLTVNYFPERLRPTPLTDVQVGSVVRTLLETVSREMATQYRQLQRVYDSAFVDTATGDSLDRVGALVATTRLRRGHAVGKVRFSRRAGSPGGVFIPVSTAVSDGAGNRYLTSDEANLLPNQATVEVWVHGENAATEPVTTGTLTVLERALAGVDRVTNDEDTYRATEEEGDDPFRARVRRAIHATGKGTPDALRYGLEALPFVSAVSLTEYPDPSVPLPGMVRVDVALSEDNERNRGVVDRRLEELRPAGIHVERSWAGRVVLGARVRLVLAGATLPTSALADVQDGIRTRLQDYFRSIGPGGSVRRARLSALVLEDDRVVDTEVGLTADGATISGDTWTLPAGKAPGFDAAGGVAFEVEYESAASATASTIVHLDADVVTAELRVTIPALEAFLKGRLEAFVSARPAGAPVTFDQVATALRDDSKFALARASSVVAFDTEGGGFTEMRDDDPAFTVPAGATLQVRAVRVREAEA